MGYYEGEKSVGLGPIVVALSLVAMVGFACLYFLFGHSIQSGKAEEMSAPQTQQVQTEKESIKPNQHSRV